MPQREKVKGKVIPFTPRTKPKLKKLHYEDPAQKQLRKERIKKRKDAATRSTVIRHVSIFIVICMIIYFIKFFL
ncbi:hypothetical protein [Desulforamulus reducens]|uniref:hypothetical protein n=1 Tax=Desulforamulus reducens TaxID=59610 RepID=UPI0002D6F666|nr:hypothetical protein [Desulforamulus reducens]